MQFFDNTPKYGMRAVLGFCAAVFVAGLLIGNVVAGRAEGASASNTMLSPDGADLTPLFTAWKLLDENYVPTKMANATSTTPQDKVWGAIEGLASSVGDPYTVFFPPQQNQIFASEVSGDFGGVGMEVGINKDGALSVISPLKDTPAARAGIKSGDVILTIDGKDTSNMSVDDAVSLIRGKAGTSVKLQLQRGAGKPFDVAVVRGTITLPTVDANLRPDGVFVIKVYTFNALAPQMFQSALRQFADSGSNKLVIDLRGNPGGYLSAAVDMASWFLPVGDVIVTEDYGSKQPADVQRSRGYDVFDNGNTKIAILIDGGSASAAEIFAGALHDHHKATLIGEQSFGKGSVQQLFDITPDTSLKVTIARWLTPDGTSISRQGITPDITVPITDADAAAGKDPQLDRAASFLITGK
jgi:carboxyl-terminal processing protease